LALLAGLAYIGARIGSNVIVSIALAILLPLTAAVCWARFVGPKAAARLADPQRLLLELALFGICCLGLVLVGAWIAAIALAVLYLIGTTHGRRGG
jgi:Protein of unknown function (DUF2568)